MSNWGEKETKKVYLGYLAELKGSSKLCTNFDWGRAIWKEEVKNVHVMGVEGVDGAKGSAVMAIIGRIKYASLGSLGDYDSKIFEFVAKIFEFKF